MPATLRKAQAIRLAPASLPAADVCIIASNAPQSVKNWALIQKGYYGNLIQVCGEQGVEDYLAIQRGINAGAALLKPFSVYFSAGTYNISTNITLVSNMRLIFDCAEFVATASGFTMFNAVSSWTNISSEGKVTFDGVNFLQRCLWMPGPTFPVNQDKYFNWEAETTVKRFTEYGFSFSRGKHYRIKDFTCIDQGYALSFTGYEDVMIDKWRILYTDISTCSYNTGTAIFTNGLATVTGVGTNWTSGMVGAYISPVPIVDLSWYQIASVQDATHLTLTAVYALVGGPATTYLIITSNKPNRMASDFYPTADPPFGRGLHIGDIFIDGGNKQNHAFGSSPGGDLLRSLEDVQVDKLTIRNFPKVDQTPVIWAWVLGFKMSNFYSDGAQIIVQGADMQLEHGYIRRCPSGGLTVHPLAGGVRDVVLHDITSCNNGHFATTVRPLHGIRIGGQNAANPTERVKLSNIRCYDDQDQMTNLLASNALAGQKQVVMASLFSNKQWWYAGQQITISDLTPLSENVEISAIDYNTQTITLTANLANTYTVAQTARITGRKTQKKGVWLSGYLRDITFGSGCDFRGTTEHGVFEGVSPDGYALDVDRIEGNVKIVTTELDLSGAGTDVAVYHATTPGQIIGYTLVYTEASSADAGVNVRLGRYNVGTALDDDYYDISVSEASKALGYTKTFYFADMTQTKIAAGDTLTFGTAGGKVGTGVVKAILQIVESSD